MRLLSMTADGDLSYTEFTPANTPPYAILSHTWEDEEVTFQDLMSGAGKVKAGYRKLLFCGQQAVLDDLQYFWCDTCCIDKRDLVELTRSINSMFRWYQNAAKCYVYMADVSFATEGSRTEELRSEWEPQFRASRWFTRGWTLQELLAPTEVEFFSTKSHRLGDKQSLCGLISDITTIPSVALRGRPLTQFSISTRMKWAAGRQTTEDEDGAYCLLGIFNVFMPLIYGESKANALLRLQQAIKERPAEDTSSSTATSELDKRIYYERNKWIMQVQSKKIHGLTFSPDGSRWACGTHDNKIKSWDLGNHRSRAQKPSQTLEGHLHKVNAVRFSPDGRAIVSSSDDGTIILWDAIFGIELRRLEANKPKPWKTSALAFSPDSKHLAVGDSAGFIKMWSFSKAMTDEEAWNAPVLLQHASSCIGSLAFSPDGMLLASGDATGLIGLWTTLPIRFIRSFKAHGRFVQTLAFSPSEEILVSCSLDGGIKTWYLRAAPESHDHDRRDGTGITTVAVVRLDIVKKPSDQDTVKDLAISPDGMTLAAYGYSSTVRLWDFHSGNLVQQIRTIGTIQGLAFSSNGKLLALESYDNSHEHMINI
ncbi:hypothetical protein NX059_002397 [Plenodomus lindquistii]|nr:hypothetical protein NX059_002397 [Plenodomus lindquistii]